MGKAIGKASTSRAMVSRAEAAKTVDLKITQEAPRLFATVPIGTNRKLLERMARMVILADDNILKCSWLSIARSITDASVLGLAIGRGVTANAYIVPFWNEKAGTFDAQLIIGYKGMLDLAERSGKLVSCSYNVVREGDEFHYSLGIDVELQHKPSTDPERAKRPITHAYCAGKKTGGGKFAVVMTASEISEHRNRYAKGYDRSDSPWRTATESMFIKTCVRQAFNKRYLPMSVEDFRLVEKALHAEEYVIEGTYTVLEHEDATESIAIDEPKQNDTPPVEQAEDFSEDLRRVMETEETQP